MNCREFHDHVLDLAAGTPVPEARAHATACSGCAAQLASLTETMSVLDEWQAPSDISPYFFTRLRARLREDEGRRTQAAGWLNWFRKPGLAISMMLLMVLSIGMFQGGWRVDHASNTTAHLKVPFRPGTAVTDLQYLDKNHELLADFDLLDDVQPNQN
jgi:hypothetical protein